MEGGRFDSWKRVGHYLVINLVKTKIKAKVKVNNNKNKTIKTIYLKGALNMSCDNKRRKNCEIFKDSGFEDSGIEYKTFDEGRITQATLYGVGANLDSMLHRTTDQLKYFDYTGDDFGMFGSIPTLPNSFVAKAKAHPHDIEIGAFNPDTGMDIAHDRVMDKYHKVFDKKFVDVMSDANQLVARLIHYANKKGIDTTKVKSINAWLSELEQN